MFPLGLWSNLLRFFDAADTEARYNSEEKRKLNLMVTANQVMRRVTKRNMSKPEKLWRCYLKAVSYGYGGTGNDYDFRYYLHAGKLPWRHNSRCGSGRNNNLP